MPKMEPMVNRQILSPAKLVPGTTTYLVMMWSLVVNMVTSPFPRHLCAILVFTTTTTIVPWCNQNTTSLFHFVILVLTSRSTGDNDNNNVYLLTDWLLVNGNWQFYSQLHNLPGAKQLNVPKQFFHKNITIIYDVDIICTVHCTSCT